MIPTLRAAILSREFAPTDIAGCVLWLRADRGLWQDAARTIAVTADGDPVGAWEDLSGNGNHATQATAAKRPVWKVNIVNGRPVVRLDGVDDVMTNENSINIKDDCTLFIVAIVNSATVNQGILSKGTGDITFVAWNNSASGYHMANSSVAVMATKSADSIVGSFAVFGGRYDGTTADILENGTNVGTGTHARANLQNNITLSIGQEGSFSLNGDIAQFIIYNRALSTSERQRVERHLGNHYAIPVAA